MGFYGALRVRDGQEITLTAPSRNAVGYLRLLEAIDHANPTGDLYIVTDNLFSHTSRPIQQWLTDHPRASSKSLSLQGRVGSTYKRVGGVCSGAVPSPAKASSTPMRSTRLRHTPRSNSMHGPSPGSGSVPHLPIVICAAVLCTRFKE